MKVSLTIVLIATALSLPGASSAPPSLNWYALHSSDLVKVTKTPLKMNPVVATFCVSNPYRGPSIHDQTEKFFDVYVSNTGASTIQTGHGVYPEGTVIIKQKYSDPEGKTTELYTGMIKRAKGYNPQGGDWEYFVVSGDGRNVTQSGALVSCMQCHQSYAASDYVTRTYLATPTFYQAQSALKGGTTPKASPSP
jgi:hypothetical protein